MTLTWARHYATSWDHLPAGERNSFDPIDTSFRGFGFAQLAMTSLGVPAGLVRRAFA